MTQSTMTEPTMTLVRFSELVDAYGSDVERWPEAERAGALALMTASAEAQQLLVEARCLDALLAAPEPLELSPRLAAAVRTIPALHTRARHTLGLGWWPFGSLWRPLVGFTASAVCGVLSGWMSLASETSTAIEPTVEAVESSDDSEQLADVGFAWDLDQPSDTVTGSEESPSAAAPEE